MGMPELARWTREQVLALPDDGMRHELIDGELIVTPTPRVRHQEAVMELWQLVEPYLSAHALGRCFCLPGDLEVEPGQVTQPDLFAVPPGPRFLRWEDAPRPFLIIEVASPSTARYDRGLKRRFCQRAGVPEYWIVDLDARIVERWRPTDARPEILDDVLTWQPSAAAPALTIDLSAFFARIMDPP